MRRFFRLLGFLSVLGAAAWAMRDRFISLTLPREPEPPSFRSPPVEAVRPTSAPSTVAGHATDGPDDLTKVDGVGPVYASRLNEAGITTYGQLAALSEDRLSEILGSRLGKIPTILADAAQRAES